MAALGQKRKSNRALPSSGTPLTDIVRLVGHVRKVPIVLKKSFWGDERKFLEPLMRFARGDVRDHIVSHKNDHGASYRRYGVLPWWSRLKINFCEIFGVVQFSTFAILSATSGHRETSGLCPRVPLGKADIST
jgi:hypothetical protein